MSFIVDFVWNLVSPYWTEEASESWTIEILAEPTSKTSNERWRICMLSTHSDSDTNLISRRLARNILKMPGLIDQNGSEEQKLELMWRFQSCPSEILGPTSFVVSSSDDPPYDALLGRYDCAMCGIRKGKGHRKRPFAKERHAKAANVNKAHASRQMRSKVPTADTPNTVTSERRMGI
ncbi:hypothetical protein P280DRAFT_286193 [Massarina eburnea CBS 473.64]|uniref:Uncharacterized protein n=1 Tax=Massarina eburnea CBS 473.64 TaxID=1395130 RepID=A0A6A6S1Z3_9PLEO|nr:hypothetical protein P280DRAFT_286193 [Massarina eburnea CBS 473.64]